MYAGQHPPDENKFPCACSVAFSSLREVFAPQSKELGRVGHDVQSITIKMLITPADIVRQELIIRQSQFGIRRRCLHAFDN